MVFDNNSSIRVIRGCKVCFSDFNGEQLRGFFKNKQDAENYSVDEIFGDYVFGEEQFHNEVFRLVHNGIGFIVGEQIDEVPCTFPDALQATSTLDNSIFSVHRLSKMVRMNQNPDEFIFDRSLSWSDVQRINKKFTYTVDSYFDMDPYRSYKKTNRTGLESLYEIVKKYETKPDNFDVSETKLGQIIPLKARDTKYYLVPSDCACCS